MSDREFDDRSVNELVQAIVRMNGWQKQLDLHSIFLKWGGLVPKSVSEHSKPVKIDRDVLWLEVENSSWMAEFQYYRVEIIDSVNSVLSLGHIKDVKMALPRKGHEFFPAESGKGPKMIFESPDPELVEEFERKASCISDEKCRQSLVDFWYLANACKRIDDEQRR